MVEGREGSVSEGVGQGRDSVTQTLVRDVAGWPTFATIGAGRTLSKRACRVDFEEFLTELREGDSAPRYSRLLQLAGLTPEALKEFEQAWRSVPPHRKRETLDRMAELSEDNLELDFDSVFRAGLGDGDAGVRADSVRGLWECEDRALIRPLLDLLEKDPAVEVRAAAATALGRFAELAHEGKLLSRDETRIRKALIAAIGRDGEDMEVRRRAIEAIASLDSPERDRIIRAAYESGDAGLLQSAVYAMGRSSNADWLPDVLRETGNESPAIRYEVAVACGHLGDEEVAPQLITLVQDGDRQVQLAAVKALGEVGGSLARRALQRCLELGDEALKQAAEEAITNIEFDDDPLALRFGS